MLAGRSQVWFLCLALSALTGCAGPGGFGSGHDANSLREDVRLIREQSAAPVGIGRELDKRPADEYRVEPGDVLLVQPVELASQLRLPGDQTVLSDGTIRMGQLGKLLVMNMTVEEIQRAVEDRMKELNVPDRVTVRLVTRDSKVFYVLGEVNAPGAFQLKGRETALDAILAAGGLNSNASRKSIILVRPTTPDSCRIVLPVDYTGIVQLGDTGTNYQLRAGDRLYIPCKSSSECFMDLFGENKCKLRSHAAPPCYPRCGGIPCSE